MKKLIEIKSIDTEKKTISAYVSTYEWDRTDEKFAQGAWDLQQYIKNPVGLWAHNAMGTQLTAGLPIMKNVSMTEDEQGLYAVSEFDTESEFAMKVFSLYQRGFLNSFSVGFRPKQNGYRVDDMGDGRKGIVWTDVELLEYSAVPVPANPGATMAREELDLCIKDLAYTIGEKNDGGNFVINFSTTEYDREELKKTISSEVLEKVEDSKKESNQFDINATLKGLIEFSKTAKNEKLDEQKISLIKISIQALQDIVLANEDQVSPETLKEFTDIVKKLAKIIKDQDIDPQDYVAKFMTQFEAALKRTAV